MDIVNDIPFGLSWVLIALGIFWGVIGTGIMLAIAGVILYAVFAPFKWVGNWLMR